MAQDYRVILQKLASLDHVLDEQSYATGGGTFNRISLHSCPMPDLQFSSPIKATSARPPSFAVSRVRKDVCWGDVENSTTLLKAAGDLGSFVFVPFARNSRRKRCIGLAMQNDLRKLIGLKQYTNGSLQVTPNVFKPHQLRSLVRQLLSGLKRLHDCNLVHRDLAERNILIRENDKGDYHLQIADLLDGLQSVNPDGRFICDKKIERQANGTVTYTVKHPHGFTFNGTLTPSDLPDIATVSDAELHVRCWSLIQKKHSILQIEHISAEHYNAPEFLQLLKFTRANNTVDIIAGKEEEYRQLNFKANDMYAAGVILHNLIHATDFTNAEADKIIFEDLRNRLVHVDPVQRLTVDQALAHPYFVEDPEQRNNLFQQYKGVPPAEFAAALKQVSTPTTATVNLGQRATSQSISGPETKHETSANLALTATGLTAIAPTTIDLARKLTITTAESSKTLEAQYQPARINGYRLPMLEEELDNFVVMPAPVQSIYQKVQDLDLLTHKFYQLYDLIKTSDCPKEAKENLKHYREGILDHITMIKNEITGVLANKRLVNYHSDLKGLNKMLDATRDEYFALVKLQNVTANTLLTAVKNAFAEYEAANKWDSKTPDESPSNWEWSGIKYACHDQDGRDRARIFLQDVDGQIKKDDNSAILTARVFKKIMDHLENSRGFASRSFKTFLLQQLRKLCDFNVLPFDDWDVYLQQRALHVLEEQQPKPQPQSDPQLDKHIADMACVNTNTDYRYRAMLA